MSKHTYFLGIGGTLMASLAQLAKELGHTVTGSPAIYLGQLRRKKQTLPR